MNTEKLFDVAEGIGWIIALALLIHVYQIHF